MSSRKTGRFLRRTARALLLGSVGVLAGAQSLTFERAAAEYFYLQQLAQQQSARLDALRFRSQVAQCTENALEPFCRLVMSRAQDIMTQLDTALAELEVPLDLLREYYCSLQGSDVEGGEEYFRCVELRRIEAHVALTEAERLELSIGWSMPDSLLGEQEEEAVEGGQP